MRFLVVENVDKALLSNVLSRFTQGSVIVHFWDGESRRFGNSEPSVAVTFKTPDALHAVLVNPDLGFGEEYMAGNITVSHLPNFLEIVNKNGQILEKLSTTKNIFLFQLNTKQNQSKQIQHHYDLGNDFFRLWLDTSMTYSCAYFHKPNDSLEKAQKQKRAYLLKKLQLQPGMTLLDIGSGWGWLLIDAAKQYKIKGTGVTLSKDQYTFAKELAKKEKVENLVSFEHMNYQDLPKKKLHFDRIISVGMFEHVGKHNQQNYFRVINSLLTPGGISVLHTISEQKGNGTNAWIDTYIFPGGFIPSLQEIIHQLSQFDMQLEDYENLRLHYALTLDAWKKRFLAHKEKIMSLYDEKFFRMWYLYLVGSAEGFRYGNLDLSQFVFTKGINNTLPLTREFLYQNTPRQNYSQAMKK